MSLKVRGKKDDYLKKVMQALSAYEVHHPSAQIEAYRQNSVSIRIRIVDPDFTRLSRSDRHDAIWQILEQLPEDVQSHISTLLLLTPKEAPKSFANVDFDNPIPSKL